MADELENALSEHPGRQAGKGSPGNRPGKNTNVATGSRMRDATAQGVPRDEEE